ncbi:cysteine--tRNA ligase [Patescibacteria group bacterium]|jgi:cysteinyl-tRNA synthetase|nr:cysteine--tRNA ligase [Patescibacteria group bacterium]
MFIPLLFGSTDDDAAQRPLNLTNTRSGEKERFTPLKDDFVRLYSCGPTVYGPPHLGNYRSFVLSDLVRRVLRFNGYHVKQVMNLTDVGHLVSDGDVGEDKMANALRARGLEPTLANMRALADEHIAQFLADLDALNIKRPHAMPRPSDCIPQQIALIETLVEKGYAYPTSDGVYFDTARFPDYGSLGNIDLSGLREGARVEEHPEKRSPSDFALWKREESIGWESPWGRGFPGWHIECSAMAMEELGRTIDIHTGGEDLARTHHNNEIAQSEAATGRPFVRYWLHNAFITIEKTKISKSLGNTFYLRHLADRGLSPLSFRYWLLTGHYRSPMNFSWEALTGAQTALLRLTRVMVEELGAVNPSTVDPVYEDRFLEAINDDLDTPRALALTWELAKDEELDPAVKKATLARFDTVLALGLRRAPEPGAKLAVDSLSQSIPLAELPEEVRLLVIAREEMRQHGNYSRADELREEIRAQGFEVTDTDAGSEVRRA